MAAVLLGGQRQFTPRNWTAATDPAVTSDAAHGYLFGDVWLNTASGNVFDAVSVADGAAVWRHRPRILGMSSAASTHTGSTAETALATITVPAGAMGANGLLRIRAIFSMTNNGNNKTTRVRYSTISGTQYDGITIASVNGIMRELVIGNRNATNSQVGRYDGTGTGGWASFGTAAVTSAIDTTASTTLVLSGTLANSADSVGLDFYSVELLRP